MVSRKPRKGGWHSKDLSEHGPRNRLDTVWFAADAYSSATRAGSPEQLHGPRAAWDSQRRMEDSINHSFHGPLSKQKQHFKFWQRRCFWQNYPDCFAVFCPGFPRFYFRLSFPVFKFKKKGKILLKIYFATVLESSKNNMFNDLGRKIEERQ